MSLFVVATRSRRIQAAYERSLRFAAGDAGLIRMPRLPRNSDAATILLDGERFLTGDETRLRYRLRESPGRIFVPVHYPCLGNAGTALDLIAVQPRAFTAPPFEEHFDADFRIAASVESERILIANLRDSTEPWAGLSVAVAGVGKDPAQAVDRLSRIWTNEQAPPVIRALVLRNLIVLLMQQDNYEKARELLNLGMSAYPDYAELRYLSGLLWLIVQKFTAAKKDADLAMTLPVKDWIGSGGETSHRPAWIAGVCASIAGRQDLAVNHFMRGILARPVFVPAVESLLNVRLSTDLADTLQFDLRSLTRRHPEYAAAVVEYLLVHRCFIGARRIIETVPISVETFDTLTMRLVAAERPFHKACEAPARPGVVIQAPFFQQSSLGRIGRDLGLGLLDTSENDICLDPTALATIPEREFVRGDVLAQAMIRHPQRLDLTLRSSWPPDFRRPSRGKLAVLFPWEYQGMPRHWVDQMRDNCDEVWTPSRFVAVALERAGMDASRVRVIPNGIDPSVFSPHGVRVPLPGARGFVFLFVGGAIARKGFDLLLDAYREAFRASDDVTLIIKESGANSFYSHNSLVSQTGRFASGTRSPHLILHNEPMDDATLAALYRASDCLVHPYRGEGFGMTLAEAMACGKPVITTGQGPAPEFVDEVTGWLIPARSAIVPDDPPPVGEMTEPLAWFEPSFESLVWTMREVYEHRAEAARKGAEAARRIHASHAWPRIIEMYSNAIREICGVEGMGGVRLTNVASEQPCTHL